MLLSPRHDLSPTGVPSASKTCSYPDQECLYRFQFGITRQAYSQELAGVLLSEEQRHNSDTPFWGGCSLTDRRSGHIQSRVLERNPHGPGYFKGMTFTGMIVCVLGVIQTLSDAPAEGKYLRSLGSEEGSD